MADLAIRSSIDQFNSKQLTLYQDLQNPYLYAPVTISGGPSKIDSAVKALKKFWYFSEVLWRSRASCEAYLSSINITHTKFIEQSWYTLLYQHPARTLALGFAEHAELQRSYSSDEYKSACVSQCNHIYCLSWYGLHSLALTWLIFLHIVQRVGEEFIEPVPFPRRHCNEYEEDNLFRHDDHLFVEFCDSKPCISTWIYTAHSRTLFQTSAKSRRH